MNAAPHASDSSDRTRTTHRRSRSPRSPCTSATPSTPGPVHLRTPLVMANSYVLPDDPSAMSWSSAEGLVYTRNSGANQVGLETKLAALEGRRGRSRARHRRGGAARGLLHAPASGDHVVVSDVTYEAVWRLFSRAAPEKYGIEATFVDISDLDAVRARRAPEHEARARRDHRQPDDEGRGRRGARRDRARCRRAAVGRFHLHPAAVLPPARDGADLVVHSLTKYINGHGDAMGGVVIGAKRSRRARSATTPWSTSAG